MASKNRGPDFPYIIVPMGQDLEPDFACAEGHQDRGPAVARATELAGDGTEVVLYEASAVFKEVRKVDQVWQRNG